MADAASGSNQPVIIIKKKKAGGHGHHGGAWKVAYADFVTAMMAFFLLLWLLNATTEEQRTGIANYFSPSVATTSNGGSDGVMGGRTVTTDGSMITENATPSVTVEINARPFETEETDGSAATAVAAAPTEDADETASAQQQAPQPAHDQQASTSDQEAQKLLKELEDEQFRQAEYQLRQAIQQVPDLKTLAQNLIIDRTPEGMRIQLVDQDRVSMFASGSAKMEDYTKKLLDLVAQVVARMPNKISISGHPFPRRLCGTKIVQKTAPP